MIFFEVESGGSTLFYLWEIIGHLSACDKCIELMSLSSLLSRRKQIKEEKIAEIREMWESV